ncbi:MAG: hypothetical protein U0325_26650 [Polyangiales bacterium]
MRTRTRFRRTLLALCALALLVRAPALIAPPALDDHVQAAMAEGTHPGRRAPWDYYAFARGTAADQAALRAEGTLPWWTADDYQLVMFRPLASVLIAADHHLLRHWSVARLHSVAWAVALLLALGAMLRRRVGEGAALVATGLMALDDALTTPLAWHANRCALEAVTLGLVAVDALLRFVEAGRRRDLALGLGVAALACLFGEYAWTILPAAALMPTDAPARRRGVRLGLVALAVAYAVARGAFGAGVRGCVLYPEFSREPFLMLFVLPRVWGAMLADFFSGIGVEARVPDGATKLRELLLVASIALVVIAWRGAEATVAVRRALRGALYAGLASMAVVSTAWLSARLMLGASLWSAALLGVLVARGPRRGFGAVALAALLLLHVPVRAWGTWQGARIHLRATRAAWRGADTLLPEGVTDSAVYVLNAVEPEEVYFGRYTRLARGLPGVWGWFVLSSTTSRVHVFREGPRTLSLVTTGGLVEGVTPRFFRSGRPMPAVGASWRVGDATVTVLAATPTAVRRVRVVFDVDLADPAVTLLASGPGGLRRFTPPAVGASAELPAARQSSPPQP